MKFSIIIPASNAQNTIERAVRSVFENKTQDIQCIVIVNNSFDNTYEVSETLASEYPSLIIKNSDCSGVSAARNEGLSLAAGDVIGFLDADDNYEPGAMDKVKDIFTKYDSDIVATRYYRTTNGVEKKTGKPFGNRSVAADKFRELLIVDDDVLGSVCNKFYRRSVIAENTFDPSLSHCEDTYFNMCILNNTQPKIFMSDEILYTYFENPGSATRDVSELFDMDNNLKYFAAFDNIERIYKDDKSLSKIIGYKRLKLATENYRDELSDEQKNQLKTVILDNLKYSSIWNSTHRYIHSNARKILKGK